MKSNCPPLGLRPRSIVVTERAAEILEAMLLYVHKGYEIPHEWREELDDLLDDRDVWEEAPNGKKS